MSDFEQLKESMRSESKKIAALKWPQKIGYIWGYYKVPIIVFIAVVALAIYLISSFFNKKEELLSGIFINTSVTDEGYELLSEGLLEELKGDPKEQVVYIHRNTYIEYNGNNSSANTGEVMKVIALMSNQVLDFMICDQAAFDNYAPQDGFRNLAEFLPEDLQEELEDLFVTVTSTETGETYPAGLDITELPYTVNYELSADPCYLAFPASSTKPEETLLFLEYFLSLQ